MDVADTFEQALNRFAYVRIQVNRIDEFHLPKPFGCFSQCLADLLKALAKILATMTCHQHHTAPLWNERETLFELSPQRRIRTVQLIHDFKQRIDNSVPGHMNTFGIYAFIKQVLPRDVSRREVQCCQASDQVAVAFLRPWGIKVFRSQPSLYMGDWYLLVIGGKA